MSPKVVFNYKIAKHFPHLVLVHETSMNKQKEAKQTLKGKKSYYKEVFSEPYESTKLTYAMVRQFCVTGEKGPNDHNPT